MDIFVRRVLEKDGSVYSDEEHRHIDKFVDEELESGGIIKVSKWHFTGVGLAEKATKFLESHGITVEDESTSDMRVEDRAKGQSLYFVVKTPNDQFGITFSWAKNGFHIGELEK